MKSSNKSAPSIKVAIVFGNPRIECARFGICEMNMLSSDKTICKCAQTAEGKLISVSPTTLILQFDRTDISDQVFQKHLSSDFFKIEVNTSLPVYLTNKLKMKSIEIKKGNYPIHNDGVRISVELY